MADSTDTFFSSVSPKQKIIITGAIYYCNIMLGLCFNFLGPCINYFSRKFGEEVKTVSIVFSIITGAYVAGSFLYLIFGRLIGRHRSAILFLLMFAVTLFCFPFLSSKWPFFILGAVAGMGIGGYDPAQVAWIINMWGHKAGPFILGQHFFFSVGTVLPPVLLAPFLPPDPVEDATTTTPPPDEKDTLFIPFLVGGILSCIAVVIQVALYIHLARLRKQMEKTPQQEPAKLEMETSDVVEDQTEVVHEDPRIGKWLVVLSCCFIGGYQGMEMDNLQFLPTFATSSPIDWIDDSYAANIASACTGAFAVGRGIGIFVVMKVAAEYILAFNFVFLIAGTLCLFFMGNSVTLLWIGASVLGLGFSTNYPGFFAFIEKHMVVTDFRAGLITMSGGFVAFVYPFLVGEFIEEHPRIMNYVTFFSLGIMFVTFSTTYYLTMVKYKKRS